jgi:capsid protein
VTLAPPAPGDVSVGTYTSYGYHAARVADREGRSPPSAGAASSHDRFDRERLIAQSRQFLRNNGLYRGIARAWRQLVHGDGFKISVRPADASTASEELKAWCNLVEADWRAFWAMPDVRGRLSGRRFGGLIADELFAAGDVGVVLADVDGGRLQAVEAEQIKGKGTDLEDGIKKDTWGRPEKYIVAPYDSRSGSLKLQDAKEYTPEQFLLVGCQDRASSTRGVPPCQASFPNIHRIEDIANSEAIGWQMRARIAVLVNRKAGPPAPGEGNREDPNRSAEDGDNVTPRVVDVGVGLFLYGDQGDEVKGLDKAAPGGPFRESFAALARLLGLPIGMPLELILGDWTQSNYSQTRAVIALCADAFLEWQLLLEESFYAPVQRWRLERQIRAGKLAKAPGDVVVEWIKPAFPWIDLLAETQAHGESVARGFSNYSEVVKSQNRDPDAVRAQQARDVVEAIKIADQIERDHPGRVVPYQVFCGLPVPGAPGAAAPPEGKKPEPKPGEKPAQDAAQAPPPARKEAA